MILSYSGKEDTKLEYVKYALVSILQFVAIKDRITMLLYSIKLRHQLYHFKDQL
jgi:hypothetical protein